MQLKIKCKKVLVGVKIGDSIATNGTCLTIKKLGAEYFIADCMYETIKRTNLKRLKNKDIVNLEKSITLSTPLGGHLVTGDVDCEGIIKSINIEGIAKIYEIEISEKYIKYVIEKGRVTIDGASLTVIDVKNMSFSVSLIPHTQEMISLRKKNIGDFVNIETDIIGKYIERFLKFDKSWKKSEITEEFLLKNGF